MNERVFETGRCGMQRMYVYGSPQMAVVAFAIALVAAASGFGCATTPEEPQGYEIPSESSSAALFRTWFEGDLEPESVDLPPSSEASSEEGSVSALRLFTAAEIAYWSGDVERAFEGYARMIRSRPGHPLVRYAAARLYGLRDKAVDYRDRTAAVLRDVEFSQVQPLARVYLSLAGQVVRYRRWKASESEKPFRADGLGFPVAWRRTPRLSPWQALDFDRTFALEKASALKDRYVSPWFAKDRDVNRKRTRPYLSGGLTLSPDFGSSGIYYLETFVTVDSSGTGGAAGGRRYWLYGNFPGAAKVWIDGTLVLEREMGRYTTGKRFRRIRLSEGTHRVLVKLGYQAGYRDWFDVAFLADRGRPLGGSGMEFGRKPPEGFSSSEGGIELLDEQMFPSELEPAFVRESEVGRAPAASLYLSALGAYFDRQPRHFDPSWKELMDRFPEFAPGYGLKAEQVRTLWELPSAKRQAQALSYLREARSHDEKSLLYTLRLASRLKARNRDSEEARRLFESARDRAWSETSDGRRLRNIDALTKWASYLSSQSWGEPAERAWEAALAAAPSHCFAARRLQNRYASRSYYPPLGEMTPEYEECPELERSRVFSRPDRQKERLAYQRRRARRYPFRPSNLIPYVEELRAQDRTQEAIEVLERARDRMPWSNRLWVELAEFRLAKEGPGEAIETLRRAMKANGSSRFLLRRMADLENEIPLRSLMRDGREAAMEHLEQARHSEGERGAAKSSDEAYYVVDYAAREYDDNGTSRTLTHTIVRTMTKGAIDRFGETSVPRNARLLRARTINQDGTTEVPERTAGKSTLSMPGLDEGDFVELAYIQYDGSSGKAESHVEGIRFFFRMSDISSLHSEYAIVGDHDGRFIRQNGPPEAKPYERGGYEGVHFLREDSPRPRGEPYSVGGEEFLPWVQFYRVGVELDPFDMDRRYVADRVLSSLEISNEMVKRVEEWREGSESSSRAEVRQLFYEVAQWVTDPNNSNFRRDASHTLASKEGNPHVLLEAVYEIAGVDSDIYLVKSKYKHPDEFPVREFAKYRAPLVRAELPDGEAVWLDPGDPDAMFDVVNLSVRGQPAVCVSCEELVRRNVPQKGYRESAREISVDAELGADGTLEGRARVVFQGVRAASVRATLRRTPEKTERRKFLSRILNGILPGSSATRFRIEDEQAHDDPLSVTLDFERPNFATSTSGGDLRVQTALFREPVASAYAKLQRRVRPMMIPRQRETNYELTLTLPEGYGAALKSRSGSWRLDSEWGEFSRTVRLTERELTVKSALHLPIQRVSTRTYPRFQKWAFQVERSSRLLMVLPARE